MAVFLSSSPVGSGAVERLLGLEVVSASAGEVELRIVARMDRRDRRERLEATSR